MKAFIIGSICSGVGAVIVLLAYDLDSKTIVIYMTGFLCGVISGTLTSKL